MKARYIAYIIWTVIALLGVISWVVPNNGISIGGWQLRWVTLADVLGSEEEESSMCYSDSTWLAGMEEYEMATDTTRVFVAQKRVLAPLQPKQALHDSLLRQIADSIKNATKEEVVTKPTVVERSSSVVEDRSVAQVAETNKATSSSEGSSGEVVDSRRYLSAFYEALDSAGVMPVRVVHYGDSQIEEDRISNILRGRWQEAYGGGGVGLIPLHQTIPTRSVRQWLSIDGVRQSSKGGPKRYMIYGPRSRRQESNDYGVMGHVAVMDHGLVDGSEDVVMHIEPAGKKHAPHQYFSQIRLLASHVEGEVRSKDTTLAVKPYGVSVLLEQTDRCEIRLHGKGKVYGVSLETPTGVMVDNIPMRGSSGVIFTRLESRSLSDYYSATNTRLLILQYGGNMIPQSSKKSTIDGYVKNLRTQINHLRRCAPYASILFIGPSDMSTRINGKMVTYPMVPYLDKKLREMAQEEKISYWSMYEAMGGKNSMVEWVEKGLAGSDYVHFTRAGANKVGQMLGKWIDEGKR
jgi:lysophospholipase L1-like esterase